MAGGVWDQMREAFHCHDVQVVHELADRVAQRDEVGHLERLESGGQIPGAECECE
jgi:hypothetical protein